MQHVDLHGFCWFQVVLHDATTSSTALHVRETRILVHSGTIMQSTVSASHHTIDYENYSQHSPIHHHWFEKTMSEVKCRKYILKSHFSGMPKREDLEIVEETLPPLKDGGIKRFLFAS